MGTVASVPAAGERALHVFTVELRNNLNQKASPTAANIGSPPLTLLLLPLHALLDERATFAWLSPEICQKRTLLSTTSRTCYLRLNLASLVFICPNDGI
jgi:hypothetical protein